MGAANALNISQQGVTYFDGVHTFSGVDGSTAGFVLTSNGTGMAPSFQSASASGAITSITGNSGGAEVPSSGNFNVLGTGSITVAGSANTETIQLTGLTNHNVLVGAGTATITNVAPSATSGVPLISQGAAADPAFGTAVVAGGGTGIVTTTAYAPICGGTTATGAFQAASTGLSTSGFVLTSNGASALPSFQSASASGAITTITGNSGGAESPSAGNFNIVGTGSITVAGSANTETVQLTGLTNHAVLVGAGTATITNVGPSSTTGAPLISAGSSADPGFSTTFTIVDSTGIATITKSVASAVTLAATNTNNASASAAAVSELTVGGTSGGSPYQIFAVTGSNSWTHGNDNGDSQSYKIAQSSGGLATNTSLKITTTGFLTMPRQAAFVAFSTSTQSNVTGAGASVTVVFGSEIADQGANYNPATGVYTAPITALHRFNTNVLISDAATATHGQLAIVTSNRSYPGPIQPLTATNLIGVGAAAFADMDAADTCSISATAYGMAGNTADIDGTGGQTYFGGNIEC